ncbi:MAG: hypothetical protein JXQ75_23985 [Phycisphaerae bacterium]|nr:hypothetical protein [Phycisphaerae bacterium]
MDAEQEQVAGGAQPPPLPPSEVKPSRWPAYWPGAVLITLLFTAGSFFSGDVNKVMAIAFASALTCFALYPAFIISLNMLRGNIVVFILVTIFLSGAPVMALLFGGLILGFSRITLAGRFLKFYIAPVIAIAAVGMIKHPEMFRPDGTPEAKEPRAVEQKRAPGSPAKKPEASALPPEAERARDLLVIFSDMMEMAFYAEGAVNKDIRDVIVHYGPMKASLSMSTLRDLLEDGKLHVRVHGDSYEAALRWSDDQWWVYAFPKPSHTSMCIMARSPPDVPPFDAIRPWPAKPSAPAPAQAEEKEEVIGTSEQKPSGQAASAARPAPAAPPPAAVRPEPPRPGASTRSSEDWAGARQQVQVTGVLQGKSGRMALIGDNVYHAGDTVSVTYKGRTYTFTVAEIQQHDAVLVPMTGE